MNALLGIAHGTPGSGRARYAVAMTMFQTGQIGAAVLEAYRIAAASDIADPADQLRDSGLTLPASVSTDPQTPLHTLVREIDRYIATLTGPGIADVRHAIGGFSRNPATPRAATATANAVVHAHLRVAIDTLTASHPGLASAMSATTPGLDWISYDGYDPAEIGESFARNHAYAMIIGADGPIPALDFDLGLFLIAPHILYRDHHHAAPELYAPLTGPHGWRFGPDRRLTLKPAHHPVWNPPYRPHLTKVGPTPFLAIFAWTRDVKQTAKVIPASDWPQLETLRLSL